VKIALAASDSVYAESLKDQSHLTAIVAAAEDIVANSVKISKGDV
jgi:hypothetical protein